MEIFFKLINWLLSKICTARWNIGVEEAGHDEDGNVDKVNFQTLYYMVKWKGASLASNAGFIGNI